ncbi:MAG: hypothetical protein HZA34_01970 [Candidatus Pacebacteria bacterium]|nr:hypothetical protein [Candidatus Paceibacterota bacterium]
MTPEQLSGYLLEEALAYLIRSSGYKLIVEPNGEPNLRTKGNGLQVRGRGGWHQADTLGRLAIIPAFTFPMRLFIEAKYNASNPVGVGIVRNAVGTIFDLNTTGLSFSDGNPLPYNYRYEYALFSASGFNQEAIELALAHGISLVDMNTSEYRPLLDVIHQTAASIVSLSGHQYSLGQVRSILRNRLETSELRMEHQNHSSYLDIWGELDELVRAIHTYDKLYIGTVNAPFMLLLKADVPQSFEDFSLRQEGVEHLVEIHWDTEDENGEKWTINPENNSSAYRLSFKVPKALYRWIFTKEAVQIERARDAKKRYLSEICVYLHNEGVDKVIKLKLSETFINSLATS